MEYTTSNIGSEVSRRVEKYILEDLLFPLCRASSLNPRKLHRNRLIFVLPACKLAEQESSRKKGLCFCGRYCLCSLQPGHGPTSKLTESHVRRTGPSCRGSSRHFHKCARTRSERRDGGCRELLAKRLGKHYIGHSPGLLGVSIYCTGICCCFGDGCSCWNHRDRRRWNFR